MTVTSKSDMAANLLACSTMTLDTTRKGETKAPKGDLHVILRTMSAVMGTYNAERMILHAGFWEIRDLNPEPRYYRHWGIPT